MDQKSTAKKIIKIRIVNPEPPIISPVDQSWNILDIATKCPPRTWEAVFNFAKAELKDVSDILSDDEKMYGGFYPLKKDIFKAFELTPLPSVKVVLIGQDPYPQTLGNGFPRAQGLSFSVSQDDQIPSSLNNMYTELEKTVSGFKRPWHGDLTNWAKQGVLLLNNCLTVRPGKPDSHGKIWMGFISRVLAALAENCPYAVYILLGKNAQNMRKYIHDRAPIVEAVHPSGLSANRGFFGSNIFNKTNELLKKNGQPEINWQI